MRHYINSSHSSDTRWIIFHCEASTMPPSCLPALFCLLTTFPLCGYPAFEAHHTMSEVSPSTLQARWPIAFHDTTTYSSSAVLLDDSCHEFSRKRAEENEVHIPCSSKVTCCNKKLCSALAPQIKRIWQFHFMLLIIINNSFRACVKCKGIKRRCTKSQAIVWTTYRVH